LTTKNFKLTIQYDGTDYCGWQIQKNAITVQATIKKALEEIVKTNNVNVIGSGRTDSGVHSVGQVCSVKLKTNMTNIQLLKALNSKLPNNIRVSLSEIVDDKFNARFSAVDREYIYKIKKESSPFDYKYYWNYPYDYDINILNNCAKIVIEQNNFYNFCKPSPDIKNYNCTINYSQWEIENDILIYQINANRFLHHMVRMLVGTMLEVSRGKILEVDFLNLFNQNLNKNMILTAPSKGLYLFKVKYENE
tara:strand:- start:2000 stop:2746 length:747 start_codon:yes stop_codon:yes gene_type:complete